MWGDRFARELVLTKFEYKVLAPKEDVMGLLNTLGAEGWELVTVTYFHAVGQSLFYMKRRVQE